MPILIVPGLPYRSRKALKLIEALNVGAQNAHVTPDGYAVLAPFAGRPAPVSVNGVPVPSVASPLVLHVLRDDGLNLEHVVTEGNRLVVKTVALNPVDLPDLERLAEYDHLPEARKDYTVYPRGHKLA